MNEHEPLIPQTEVQLTPTFRRLNELMSLRKSFMDQKKLAAKAQRGGYAFRVTKAPPELADSTDRQRYRLWTPEFIIHAIQTLRHEGLPSNTDSVYRHSIFRMAHREFGSWEKAVEAAGIAYAEVRIGPEKRKDSSLWSKETIISELQRRKSLGLQLQRRVLKDEHPKLIKALNRLYGKDGWQQAMIDSGFDPGSFEYGLYRAVAAAQALQREGAITAETVELIRKNVSGELVTPAEYEIVEKAIRTHRLLSDNINLPD